MESLMQSCDILRRKKHYRYNCDAKQPNLSDEGNTYFKVEGKFHVAQKQAWLNTCC